MAQLTLNPPERAYFDFPSPQEFAPLHEGCAGNSCPSPASLNQNIFSIDCEMVVSTASAMDLAKICVVQFPDGTILLDTLVLPSAPVQNFVTEITGFTSETFLDREKIPSQEDVRSILRNIIKPHDILCGHQLAGDLRAIGIHHPHVVDTIMLFPHPDGPPHFHTLKYLARQYAHTNIQAGVHSSVEDAQAVNAILRFYIFFGFLKPVWDRIGETFEPSVDMIHAVLAEHCNVAPSAVKCIYVRGSRAVGTAAVRPCGKLSDWDFVVVVDAPVVPDTLLKYGNLDICAYNVAYFTRLVQDHIIWALECVFAPPHAVWQESIDFRAVLAAYQALVQRAAWLPLLRASVSQQCSRKMNQARRVAKQGLHYQAAKYVFIGLRFVAYGMALAASGTIERLDTMNSVWFQMRAELAADAEAAAKQAPETISDLCQDHGTGSGPSLPQAATPLAPRAFVLDKYIQKHDMLAAEFRRATPKLPRHGGFRAKVPMQLPRHMKLSATRGDSPPADASKARCETGAEVDHPNCCADQALATLSAPTAVSASALSSAALEPQAPDAAPSVSPASLSSPSPPLPIHALVAALCLKFPPAQTRGCPAWLYSTFRVRSSWSCVSPELLLLHYTPRSPSHPWVTAMRGLVLDSSRGWTPVAYPFDRFHSYGDALAAEVDPATAQVSEKLDGSLLVLYCYLGTWRVASSGRADADGPVGGRVRTQSNTTFAQLFWAAWHEVGYELEALEPTVCYMFELTSPDHVIIVRYSTTRLTLVGARSMVTLSELPVEPISAATGLALPRRWALQQSLEALSADTAAADANLTEGVVVTDAAFRRIKMKARGYVRMQWLFPLCTAEMRAYPVERLVRVVQEGESDDLLRYCPDLAPRLREVQAMYKACRQALTALHEKVLSAAGLPAASLSKLDPELADKPADTAGNVSSPVSPCSTSKAYARAVHAVSSDRVVTALLFAMKQLSVADAMHDLFPKTLLGLLLRLPRPGPAQSDQTADTSLCPGVSCYDALDPVFNAGPIFKAEPAVNASTGLTASDCSLAPNALPCDPSPGPNALSAPFPMVSCAVSPSTPVTGPGVGGAGDGAASTGGGASGGSGNPAQPGQSGSSPPAEGPPSENPAGPTADAVAPTAQVGSPWIFYEVGVIGLGPAGLAALRATHLHGITAIGLDAGCSLAQRALQPEHAPYIQSQDTHSTQHTTAGPAQHTPATPASPAPAPGCGAGQVLACGVGGASLWSDGKFSFLPAGAATTALRHADAGIAVAKEWLGRAGGVGTDLVDEGQRPLGTDDWEESSTPDTQAAPETGPTIPPQAPAVATGAVSPSPEVAPQLAGAGPPPGWLLKAYRSVKTTFAGRLALLQAIEAELAAPSPATPDSPSPTSIVQECGPVSARWTPGLGLWTLTPSQPAALGVLGAGVTCVHVRHLIFAGGRLSPLFLARGLSVSPALQMVPRRLEAGVRLLGPASHALFANSTGLLDPKWKTEVPLSLPAALFRADKNTPGDTSTTPPESSAEHTGEDGPAVVLAVEYRTFCWCAQGAVLLCDMAPCGTTARLWSGSTDTPTPSTNLGIMARLLPCPAWPPQVARALALDAARLEAMVPFDVGWGCSLGSHLGPVWGAILEHGVGLFAQSRLGNAVSLSGAPTPATTATTATLTDPIDACYLGSSPDCEGVRIIGPCVEGVGLYPRVCPSTLAAEGTPHLAFAGDCCGLFRGLVPAIVSGTTAGLEAVAAVSPAPLTGMVAPALQEIHIFLGPIDPSPETVKHYVSTVDRFNMIHAVELSGKRLMKPCHLALEFRLLGRYLRVLQSARYVSHNDVRAVLRQAYTRDVPHFVAAGFEVIRVKIEASVHGINEMPATDLAAATTLQQGRYFEHHVRLCRADRGDAFCEPLDAAELEQLQALRTRLEQRLAIPVPLSYNNNGDAQRYCNLRFRGVTAPQALQWVRTVGQTVREDLPHFKVVKSIDELVWYDTFTGLDRGWIDPTATRVVLLTGKRCSGKDTLAALLITELAARGVHTLQVAFADTMKALYREHSGVDVTISRAVKEQHRAAMSALYHQTVREDPQRFARLVAEQIRRVAADSTRASAVIVSDLRFPRDLDTVSSLLCNEVQHTVVRVQASDSVRMGRGWAPNPVVDNDATETAMDAFPCQHVVCNEGSLQELGQQARALVDLLEKTWI